MTERLAVYAGTFDPPTNGHLWMIQRGVEIFDRLIVAIGVNPAKQCRFSVEERLEMLNEITPFPNVSVSSYVNQFLVNYAQEVGARYILRGIRNVTDYEYERDMRYVNGDLSPNITTVFLQPPRDIAEISSSTVKGLIGPEGWEEIVQKYVPECVFERLVQVKKVR